MQHWQCYDCIGIKEITEATIIQEKTCLHWIADTTMCGDPYASATLEKRTLLLQALLRRRGEDKRDNTFIPEKLPPEYITKALSFREQIQKTPLCFFLLGVMI